MLDVLFASRGYVHVRIDVFSSARFYVFKSFILRKSGLYEICQVVSEKCFNKKGGGASVFRIASLSLFTSEHFGGRSKF